MRCTTPYATVCLSVVSSLAGVPRLAGDVFTIEDPPVDFEVVDADHGVLVDRLAVAGKTRAAIHNLFNY